MSHKQNLRLLTLVALLILVALPAAGYLTQLSGNHSLFPGIHPVAGATTPNVLGLDCAYGSNAEGGVFPTSVTTSAPYTGPDFDGTLDSSCQATYLADTDAASVGCPCLHPLVEDNPSNTAVTPAGAGGGLTIDVVAVLNTTTTINGFDISVKYDPHFVSGVIIVQSGLIWGGANLPVGAFVLTLAKTIDNVNGVSRVAQVLVGAPQQSGSSELFRVRFDLVGASTGTPVQIVSDTLTNPGNVQHNTNPATSVDTTAIYNTLTAITANMVASWSFSPSPEVPLSPLTFTATATCPGCTGALTFSWDFSSNDQPGYVPKSQATTNPATVTPPPPVVNRVTVTVSDAAAHSFAITRVLPLVSRESPSATTVARKALTGTFAGQWLGGVTTAAAAYTGSWTFCPGSALNKQVCSNPSASFSQTPATATQINTQPALSYNFAGIYNETFKVIDTPEQQVGTVPSGNSALLNFLVTVTGSPNAYNVNVSGNTTSPNSGQAVNFTAFSSYTLNYTTGRSNTFRYVWNFGDGSPTVTTSGNVTSTVHTCSVAGPHTVTATATETASAAVAHIVETGTFAYSCGGAFTYSIAGPATGTVGTAVTFTGTTSGGTGPFTFTWNFGDNTGNVNTGATASASHTYTTKGSFIVHGNATDSTAKVAQAPAQTITISALAF